MPDPTWEMYGRIFERERERLTIPPAPPALDMIQTMYGGRPLRGHHPRDLLERLAGGPGARGGGPPPPAELVGAGGHPPSGPGQPPRSASPPNPTTIPPATPAA